jgi:aminopeptidase N
VRDFFITASPNFQVLSSVVGEVTVNAAYLPGSEDGAAKALEVGKNAVQIYSELFGDYPYTELDIVQAPMRNALGVEYPGIVLIGAEGYAEPDDPAFTVTVAHEVAHQWWYNVVGNDVFLEPWLDEGLTTFSSAVYYEEAAGPQAYAEVRAYWQARYDKIANEGRNAPLSWSLDEFMQKDPNAYGSIAYSKGALFFDALRNEVGDEAFFAALRAYYQDQLYQIATGQDLRDAFVLHAGADVEAFFDKWLK